MQIRLERLGWRMSGYRVYSVVFTNPAKDYILKINTERDPAFLWFMFLTHKFPNPHFPRIMDISSVANNDFGKILYVYKLEKLEEVPKSKVKLLAVMGDCLNQIRHGRFGDVRSYIDMLGNKKRKVYAGMVSIDDIIEFDAYLSKNPKMEEALNIVGKNSRKFLIDAGVSNFMERKDGTLIINDPYVDF